MAEETHVKPLGFLDEQLPNGTWLHDYGRGGDGGFSPGPTQPTTTPEHPSDMTRNVDEKSFWGRVGDLVNAPLKFLPAAMRAVPAVKYALAVMAVAGRVAVAMSYFKSPQLALVATIAGIALMGLMVIFAQAAAHTHALPATIFIWVCLLLFIVWASGMTASVFLGWPLKLSIFGTAQARAASSSSRLPLSSTQPIIDDEERTENGASAHVTSGDSVPDDKKPHVGINGPPNSTISSVNQTGGITAQNVTINNAAPPSDTPGELACCRSICRSRETGFRHRERRERGRARP